MSYSVNLLPLLHTGAEDASCLEKTADCLLAYPNSLWHGRKVIPFVKDDKWEVSYERTACCNTGDLFCVSMEPGVNFDLERNRVYSYESSGAGIPILLLGPFYLAFVELPAVFCSAVGMPMKQSALNGSKKAAAYNKLMQLYLHHEELLARKKIIVDALNKNIQFLEIQKEVNDAFEPAKKQLEGLQDKFKEPKEITELLEKINSKQTNYHSLQDKSKKLQKELDFFNLEIKKCEQKIKDEQETYDRAVN